MPERVAPSVLAILRALVEERTGLHYPPESSELLEQKLRGAAFEAGFESLLDYYYYLRYDAGSQPAMDALIEALVVGETYFFRELDQLRVVVSRFTAPLVAGGARPRVWSAACSSGEEPLSLAMLLAHAGLLPSVELVATDLSAAALERARRGRWGPRAVRADLPPEAHGRLMPAAGGGYTVAPEIAAAVTWRRVNLLDEPAVRALELFDVILCRNVFIYFAEPTLREMVRVLGASLRPGGGLFVGVSESLLRFGTSLVCEEHGDVFVYRRPA